MGKKFWILTSLGGLLGLGLLCLGFEVTSKILLYIGGLIFCGSFLLLVLSPIIIECRKGNGT